MIKKRFVNTLFIIFIISAWFFLSGCRKDERALFNNIRDMESEYYSTGNVKEKERELKEAIREYRDILEMQIEAAQNLGIYHKSLGKLYFDNSMYKLGAQSYGEAIKIDPENPILFYYKGLCYARYSKSILNSAESFRIINIAEKSYLRAIELDSNYSRAMYALSILYVFEFDMPDMAIEWLEKLLEIEKSNFDAMFLLANAYVQTGLTDMADRIYLNIINNTRNADYRNQAEANRNALRDYDYGRN